MPEKVKMHRMSKEEFARKALKDRENKRKKAERDINYVKSERVNRCRRVFFRRKKAGLL